MRSGSEADPVEDASRAAPGWLEAIHARASWRSFLDEPLSAEARRELAATWESCPTPFPAQLRFAWLDLGGEDARDPKRLGTYGTILGARTYVVGAVRRGPFDLEMFGYALERVILAATRLGLGTCWLGGAFTRGHYAEWFGVRPDEILPAVTPVGKVTRHRSWTDRTLRFTAGSRARRSWDTLFFDARFGRPLRRVPDSPLTMILEAVRVGPSASNRQPWRFVCEDGGACLHLVLRRTPGYRAVSRGALGTVDLQRLDTGIAMCHVDLAAEALGRAGGWTAERPAGLELPPQADYVATWRSAADH